MTIAAGLLYQGGVVLCADTELTWSAAITHESKIIDFSCAAGTFGFACAGRSTFATAAIDKCQRRLELITDPTTWLWEIERIVDREYRRTVLSNPSLNYDSSLHYWLLIAARPISGGLFLYATDQTALKRVNIYDCIGIGGDLGRHLLGSMLMSANENHALYSSSFMLANVKGRVPGCGGLSEFLVIRNDGKRAKLFSAVSAGSSPATSVAWVEARAKDYQMMTTALLFQLMDRGGRRCSL